MSSDQPFSALECPLLMNNPASACKLIFLSSLLLCGTLCAAQTITGTVHNETTGKPAAGDEVVLLRLANGMLEETHAKTDSQGAFTLNVQFPDQPHDVRVVHQGVNYGLSVTSAGPVNINVFDAAAKVEGVSEYLSITKVESDGKNFNITELHEIKNASIPQRTQANPRNFEFVLPANAQIDSIMVAGPAGVGVKTEANPVAGNPGHYGIGFPLRPGSTRYGIRYHLPYSDHIVFQPFLPYPSKMFSVQYPNSMTFVASEKSGFHRILDQDGMRVEALTETSGGRIPDFQLSGTGTLPPDRQIIRPQSQTVAPPSPTATAKAGQAQNRPLKPTEEKRSPSSTAKAVAIGAVVVVASGAFIFLLWKVQAAKQKAARENLKEKLFQLENERLKGSISPEQYAVTKASLNRSLEEMVVKK